MPPIRVAVDALGGDRAPDEIVAGALDARSEAVQPVLFGPSSTDSAELELVETTEVIEMHEKPAEAVRGKPDSSLVAGCRSVGRGDTAAVVSAAPSVCRLSPPQAARQVTSAMASQGWTTAAVQCN